MQAEVAAIITISNSDSWPNDKTWTNSDSITNCNPVDIAPYWNRISVLILAAFRVERRAVSSYSTQLSKIFEWLLSFW